METMTRNQAPVSWEELLVKAVNEPGVIHSAYSQFYGYSIGNQLLAWWQCMERNVPFGPIGTYNFWKGKNRQVQKGQKAIMLCMPIVVKDKRDLDDKGEPKNKVIFTYKNNWFVLSQTEGEEIEYPVVPEWDRQRALDALGITEAPFEHPDGNTQGYAIPRQKRLAINPLAAMPLKTMIHEMAHCIMHDDEGVIVDGSRLDRSLKEVEAESVALIVSDALGLDGQEYSRGYIQNWYQGNAIPDTNARRIFAAADKILKAGRPAVESEAESEPTA